MKKMSGDIKEGIEKDILVINSAAWRLIKRMLKERGLSGYELSIKGSCLVVAPFGEEGMKVEFHVGFDG
jgi:hypothetical protein